MGAPLGAARHVRQALKPDGTWMIVEPYAADEAVVTDAGFTRFRRAAETQFDLVYESAPLAKTG